MVSGCGSDRDGGRDSDGGGCTQPVHTHTHAHTHIHTHTELNDS